MCLSGFRVASHTVANFSFAVMFLEEILFVLNRFRRTAALLIRRSNGFNLMDSIWIFSPKEFHEFQSLIIQIGAICTLSKRGEKKCQTFESKAMDFIEWRQTNILLMHIQCILYINEINWPFFRNNWDVLKSEELFLQLYQNQWISLAIQNLDYPIGISTGLGEIETSSSLHFGQNYLLIIVQVFLRKPLRRLLN